MIILKTERLQLIPMTLNDVPDFYWLHSFEKVARYNTIGIPGDSSVTRSLLEKVLADKRAMCWSIRKQGTNEFLGEMGMKLSVERYRKGEIHYSIAPKFWGEGYATEAVEAILDYGFQKLNRHRIEAGVAVENIKSVALLERVGMKREGICRKILPLATGWMDNYMYAILEEDRERS